MRREILRKLGKGLGVAALCGVLTIAACACGSQVNTEVTEDDVLTEVKDWVETNYGQVYEVYYLDADNEMQPIEDLEIDVDTLYADGQAALAEIIK